MDSALKAVIAAVPAPLLLIDASDRVTAANDGAIGLFGTGLEGRPYLTITRHPVVIEGIETARRETREVQGRVQMSGPSIDAIYRMVAAPIGAGGVLLAFADRTDVEEASRIRRDFVANVSHELRTPLTAILGFIETLQGAARDDEVARDRFLAVMAREAERMNRLVADLLSLSRVEALERVPPTTRIDVAEHAASVVASLRPLAEATGARIIIEGERGPFLIPADGDQMTQVLTNLIENALKYGALGGTVTLRLSHEAGPRGSGIRIDVIDDGEGIDEIHLPRLTERFYRADLHRSREEGGTGLGLAIVKHIIQRHRGRLRIQSRKGEGTMFSVLLPQQ